MNWPPRSTICKSYFIQDSCNSFLRSAIPYKTIMFKVTTRPPTSALFPSQDEAPSTHRKHPAELDGMDIDDLGEGPSSLASVVTPGEVITSAKEFMRYVPLIVENLNCADLDRGHGTYVEDESVVSSVTGTIEKVNKLISVRALKARYAQFSQPRS